MNGPSRTSRPGSAEQAVTRNGQSPAATTVQGRLVSLRPISRDDYPQLFAWRLSFDTIHTLNFRRRLSSYEEFVRELETMLPNVILHVVETRSGGEPIGYALAHSINPWDGWLAVGLYVEPNRRLTGHGAEAALLSIDFLFRIYPLRKIVTEVYDFAEPIQRMLISMGFEEAGYLPDHFWWADRWWGLRQMMLTRDTWAVSRARFSDIVAVTTEMTTRGANGSGIVQ